MEGGDGVEVRFGCAVTIVLGASSTVTYRITGEKEANPAAILIAYVATAAQALLGRGIGERATIAGKEVDIIAVAGCSDQNLP